MWCRKPAATLGVWNASRHRWIAPQATVLVGRAAQRHGLAGQPVAADTAVVMPGVKQVQGRGMTGPFGVVYYRGDRVLATEVLAPDAVGRIRWRADGVIEGAPALAEAVRPGERVSWLPLEAPRRAWLSELGWTVGLIVLFTAIVAHVLSLHGLGGDVLMDWANGRWIWTHHHVPLHNWLTPTRYGAPWSDTEWLFGVWVAWWGAHGGAMAIYWSLVAIVAVWGWGVARLARPLGRGLGAGVVLAVAMSLHMVIAPRPQLISYALWTWLLWAIREARNGRWAGLMGLLATIPVWANVHDSVFLAPAVLIGEAWGTTGHDRWRWAAAAGAAGLLMGLHPGLWQSSTGFLGTVLSPGIIDVIDEWLPWNLTSAVGVWFIPWLGLALWLWTRTTDWRDRWWLLGGAFATAFASRFVPYTVLGWVALWASQTRPMPDVIRGDRPWVAPVLVGAAILGPWAGWHATFPPAVPTAELTWLQAARVPNVFPFYPLGDALDWAGVPSFVDGRAELWAAQPWWPALLRAQSGAESPVAFQARWDPAAQAVLWPLHQPGAGAWQHAPDWRLVMTEAVEGKGSREVYGLWVRFVPPRTPINAGGNGHIRRFGPTPPF